MNPLNPMMPMHRWLLNTYMRSELVMPILTVFKDFASGDAYPAPHPIKGAKYLQIELGISHQLMRAYRIAAFDDWLNNKLDIPLQIISIEGTVTYWGKIK